MNTERTLFERILLEKNSKNSFECAEDDLFALGLFGIPFGDYISGGVLVVPADYVVGDDYDVGDDAEENRVLTLPKSLTAIDLIVPSRLQPLQ